ncbi:glycerol-3-phosphate dehydrogenase/oxidase [Terracoccus luteus]|jgi:glycerol-3-phosphate dehydrogenase|uniref:Glycerol-3-phosphate dehydrogenase n=1 Tax=Terracoccus luteus TaxID=53356 RepID=A0A839Q1H7_9MICO|nr:glycerol-3-phosphate dehydrogenase/oxidase [Terracoccus luteus]MBB2986491.1 glycerol-3-phosphate dehydrogenase [Terracoccus luteus]MCP2171920.1 glycerol-3-phosphate dehydrogenase [Terracoccus luteus]
MTSAVRLDAEYRSRAWKRLAEKKFDVLVVGGGVTGAGVALDAATRGLSTALVEQRDFGSGTSSRSSKLFHGGLRYLEQMNFDLVREALKERELMLTRIAPHLVKPVPFLYPLTGRGWERPYVTAGLTLYDTMGGARSTPRHKQLTRTGALRIAPSLRRDALTGALLYYDAQADDARHTLTTVRTAAAYGAWVLASARVVDLTRAGERIVGAVVEDVETGERVQVQASVVVNCTGVWTDDIQTMAGGRGRFHVRASKGVHIVVGRDRINSETGLILRTETSVLFVIPWGTHWIIGTTDTDWELDRSHPSATRADIDYLLEHVNAVLNVPLTHDDIQGVYAGLRPLLSGESEDTSQLSREHAVARPQPGLVSIAGGKYTTYRVMAADAVDAARADVGGDVGESVTEHIPLSGAEGYVALVNQIDRLARHQDLPVWRITHLLDRYGSLVHELFALAEDDRSLYDPLPGAEEYLTVEALYAVTHEGALHLDDVLARRTRISIETPDRGVQCAEAVARVVGPVLGWDDARQLEEVERYRARVEAERESQKELADSEANAERLSAPDIRRIPVSRAPHEP